MDRDLRGDERREGSPARPGGEQPQPRQRQTPRLPCRSAPFMSRAVEGPGLRLARLCPPRCPSAGTATSGRSSHRPRPRRRRQRPGLDRGAGRGWARGLYARRRPARRRQRPAADRLRPSRCSATAGRSRCPNTSLYDRRDGSISIVPPGQGPETVSTVGRIKLVNPPTRRRSIAARRTVPPAGRQRGRRRMPAYASPRGALESSNVNAAARWST
jgi:hypothetical protein